MSFQIKSGEFSSESELLAALNLFKDQISRQLIDVEFKQKEGLIEQKMAELREMGMKSLLTSAKMEVQSASKVLEQKIKMLEEDLKGAKKEA